MTVRVCGNQVQYAKALKELAQSQIGSRRLSVAASGGNLFNRIQRLLGKGDSQGRKYGGWVTGVVVLSLLSLIIVGLLPIADARENNNTVQVTEIIETDTAGKGNLQSEDKEEVLGRDETFEELYRLEEGQGNCPGRSWRFGGYS